MALEEMRRAMGTENAAAAFDDAVSNILAIWAAEEAGDGVATERKWLEVNVDIVSRLTGATHNQVMAQVKGVALELESDEIGFEELESAARHATEALAERAASAHARTDAGREI